MEYLPLIAFIAIIFLFVVYAGRQRRKQQAVQQAMTDAIGVGAEVMTTSGLYGTVVAKAADGTVTLSIAPGVEVRWELAALRDVAALPAHLRREPAEPAEPVEPVELAKTDGDEPDNPGGAR